VGGVMSEQLINQLFGVCSLAYSVKLGSQIMNLYGCLYIGHLKVEA